MKTESGSEDERGTQEEDDETEFAECRREGDGGEDNRAHTPADSVASDSSSHLLADSTRTYSTDGESEDEPDILESLEEEMNHVACLYGGKHSLGNAELEDNDAMFFSSNVDESNSADPHRVSLPPQRHPLPGSGAA